jgi:hypothetical protein
VVFFRSLTVSSKITAPFVTRVLNISFKVTPSGKAASISAAIASCLAIKLRSSVFAWSII